MGFDVELPVVEALCVVLQAMEGASAGDAV